MRNAARRKSQDRGNLIQSRLAVMASSSASNHARRQLQVRAEREQPAIAIFHHKLPRVLGHVRKSAHEFNTSCSILSIKRVRILDEKVRVQQLIRVFVRISRRRVGTAEVDRVLIARNDSVNRWVLPCTQTFETKFRFEIGNGAGYVQGEEYGRDLSNHAGKSTLRNQL